MAHWSSGQDASLSRWKHGFDSRTGHQKKNKVQHRCTLFFFCRPIRGISPGESSRRLASLGSHSPLGDRRAACAARHSPGGERANIRASREIPVCSGAFVRKAHDPGSHIPPEDRKATRAARHFPGAGRGYSRQRRDSRNFINVP